MEWTKIVRVVRITTLILLIGALHVSASGLSQGISLKLSNAPIEKVFVAIKKQTGYVVFYNYKAIKDAKRVTLDLKNVSIQKVLEECFKDQPFTYTISGKTILVTPKEEIEKKIEVTQHVGPLNDITGRVIDSNGKPVEGATVSVKGTKIATSTNKNGEFELKDIADQSTLIISAANIQTIERKVGNQKFLSITVLQKINNLDEVQIVAYGQTSKRFQTGNVSTVKAEEIANQPVSNSLLALEGRVPGLVVTQSTGFAGSGVKVRIQGENSIGNGSDPLYVVDGVPYISQLLPALSNTLGTSGGKLINNRASYGSPLTYINPADIESIEVLKDADATAIYGSRGANGVILITTKKAKSGLTRIDVNMQTGWGKVTQELDLLNTQQYLEMRHEAKRNDNAPIYSSDYDINGHWDTTQFTDWQKELIGNTAHYSDVQATVSGGSGNTQVMAGMGYHKETTVFPGDLSDQKGSLHFSMNNVSSNQKFRFQLTGNYLEDNNHIISRDLTQDAVKLAPNAPKIYNKDGTLNWMPNSTGASTWDNPLAYLYNGYKNKTKNLVGNAIIGYQIISGLEIKSSFGYTNLQSNDIATFPLISSRPENRQYIPRGAFYSNNNNSSWIIEPQISYKVTFGANRIEALLGSTFQQNTSNGLTIAGSGYNSDVVLEDIRSAPSISIDGTVNSIYKYNALFTRIGYIRQDKYLLNLTARRDGSSRFGPGNQFHDFWAIGAGWIFSQEQFIQNTLPFISFAKVTASYGTTGNDQIGDYRFMSLFYSSSYGVPYQGVNGMQPGGLANPFIQWEETKKLFLTLNVGMLKDRITFAAHYFCNRSGNQLLAYDLPIQTGFSGITRNLPATVQNSGWELALSTSNFKTIDFTWSSDFNLTIPRNKLIEFTGIEKTWFASRYTIGESIMRRPLLKFAGVNPATGVYQFFDSKSNITSSPSLPADQTFWVNTAPSFYGGIHNNFRYKNFDLDISFQFVKRKGPNYLFGYLPGFKSNQPTSVLQRWQKTGEITSIQRYNSNFSLFTQATNASNSSAAYGDASFARLKNLSLSWRVPGGWYKKAGVNNFRVYIQGQNLLTITNYIGLDPETLSSTTLPPLRVLVVGMQIGF